MGYYKIVSKIVSHYIHTCCGSQISPCHILDVKVSVFDEKMKQDVEKKLATEHFQCFMPVMAMRLSKAYFCIWVHKCLLFELFFQCLLLGLK